MRPGIHNYSEIGKLNKVLLHRLAVRLRGLVQKTLQDQSFDDIPYLKIAQQEHVLLLQVLRDNGVEVVYYVDETAKALANQEIKAEFLEKVHSKPHEQQVCQRGSFPLFERRCQLRRWLQRLSVALRRMKFQASKSNSLLNSFLRYPFYLDPMPNLYYHVTRRMHRKWFQHSPAGYRRREALLLKYMYNTMRLLRWRKRVWYDTITITQSRWRRSSFEQRDCSSWTKPENYSSSYRALLAACLETLNSSVSSYSIYKTRAFMHLDTVFTMVDYDKFCILRLRHHFSYLKWSKNGEG